MEMPGICKELMSKARWQWTVILSQRTTIAVSQWWCVWCWVVCFYNTKHVVMLISARRIICLSHTCCIHVYMLAKSKNDSCNALVSRHDDGTRTINTTCLWRQNNELHLYMTTVHNPKQKKQTYLLYNVFYISDELHAKFNR
jgi:hypothetical protein